MQPKKSQENAQLFPPPKNSLQEQDQPLSSVHHPQDTHLAHQNNTTSRHSHTTMRYSGAQINKEGHLETCPNSKLSRNEEESNRVTRQSPQSRSISGQMSSDVTLKLSSSHENSQECGCKRRQRGREGDEKHLGGYLSRQGSEKNRGEECQESSQGTEKTIGVAVTHTKEHLTSIIDSFETKRHLEDQKHNEKSVVNQPQAKLMNLEDNQELMSVAVTSHRLELLGINDSLGSLEHDNSCIWNQDQYQLNDVQLEALGEKEGQCSEGQLSQDVPFELELTRPRVGQEQSEKKQAQMEGLLLNTTDELSVLRERNTLLEQKNLQFEMLKQLNSQKYQELLDENKELNDLIQDYKKQVYRLELAMEQNKMDSQQLQERVRRLESHLYEKQEYLVYLHEELQQKEKEYGEVIALTEELEDILKEKEEKYEREREKMGDEMGQLKQTVSFYKERLEQDGFTFNLQEIRHLKDLFEGEIDHERRKSHSIQKDYQKSLFQLLKQKETNAQQLLKLKTNHNPQQSFTFSQLNSIFQEYDLQLQKRDEQVLALKQQLSEAISLFPEINLKHCSTYIKHMDRLTSVILEGSPPSSTELVAEFVYVLNKLVRIVQVAQVQLGAKEEQQKHLERLMAERQKLRFQEVQGLEWDLGQLQMERDALSQKYQTFKMKYYALLYQQTESGVQGSCAKFPSLSSSVILNNDSRSSVPQSNQLYETCHLQQKIENRPNVLTLEQVLTKQEVDSAHKKEFIMGLLSFTKGLLKGQKKPPSLKPNEITVTKQEGTFVFQLQRPNAKRVKESQYALFYAAPQVLLGFSQSEQSYIWTIGLLVDELLHGSFFYKKINLITSREENYKCRDEELNEKPMLEAMLRKKQKQRWSFQKCVNFMERMD